MNKRRIIVCSLCILVIATMIICYFWLTKVKKVNDIVNLDSVDRVSIVNGANGVIVDVTDDNQKEQIINSLEKLKLSTYKGETETGWIFAIILIDSDGDEEKLTFKGVQRVSASSGDEYVIENVDSNLQKLCDSFMK